MKNKTLLDWLDNQIEVAGDCAEKSSTQDFWCGYRLAIHCVIDKVIEDEDE